MPTGAIVWSSRMPSVIMDGASINLGLFLIWFQTMTFARDHMSDHRRLAQSAVII